MLERSVRDARGKAWRVPPPAVVVPTDERSKRLNALRGEVYGAPGGLGTRAGFGLLLGAIIGGMLYRECRKYLGPADQLGAITISLLAGAGAAFGGFRLNVRAPNERVVGPGVQELKMCLICGYDLRDVPPAGDGCSVCPECGAAWKVGG